MDGSKMNGTAQDPEQSPDDHLSDPQLPPARAMVSEPAGKPPAFYLSFIALNLMVFIISLDATALNVAIPVCSLAAVLVPKGESFRADVGVGDRTSPVIYMERPSKPFGPISPSFALLSSLNQSTPTLATSSVAKSP